MEAATDDDSDDEGNSKKKKKEEEEEEEEERSRDHWNAKQSSGSSAAKTRPCTTWRVAETQRDAGLHHVHQTSAHGDGMHVS